MKPYVIGMDMGGTNLRVALGPQGEEIRHFQKVPREAVLTGESPAKELADFIQDYCAQHGEGARPEAVMIGFPATLDRNRHHVLAGAQCSRDRRPLRRGPGAPGPCSRLL